MSFLGFGKSRSQQPNLLGSVQIQTSEKGIPIPYAGGTVKLPIKLLDYVDFNAVGQTSSGGGKGGGGGGVTSYEYYASIDAAVCDGPIDGLGNIYDQGGASSLSSSVETYTIPGGGGTYQSNSDTTENDEGCTYSQPYSYQVDDFGGDGPETVSGTEQVPMQRVDGSPAAGQYVVTQDNNVTSSSQGVVTGSGGFLHYTFSAADAGKVITITYTYSTNTTNYISPAAKFNFGVYVGSLVGDQWGYMAARHPERALRYPGIARVVAQNLDLGTSASPPNVNVEVINARGLSFGGGIADCDPSKLITDICNGNFNGSFQWPYLGDLTQFSNFCVANNLFQSVSYDSQRKGLDCLKEIISLANSEAVWSGPALKVIPYGSITAQGNGRTFTPQTEPVYELDDSDMIAGKGEEPILTSWPGLADNYNSVQFQYTRRDDNYNNDVLNAKDEASILMNGLLPAQTINGNNYREKNYAAVAMDMLLKRNSVALRNYTFKLKWWYFLLEPMDVVLLKRLGDRPVRITQVTENDDYSLSITAEDFVYGVAEGVLYPKGDGSASGKGAHDQPGFTSLLAAFQPNTRVTAGANQLWMALSGGSSWGGCSVWISKDGSTYSQIAKQYGAARAGSLTNSIGAGSDPDTTSTISVSTTGSLLSGTQADADAFATLCLIGKELISYETATLTGSSTSYNNYNLGTYLRRGIFANNAQAHNAGEVFVRLDNQITKYTIDPVLANSTIYLKFTSFNLYGFEEQSLADVQPVIVNLSGAVTASNMTVASFANSDGTTATVDVYKLGGNVGDSGSVTLPNGATVTLPSQAYSSEALGTWYGINYNPATAAYVLYTDPNAWRADQATMIAIGSTTTPTAGATATYPASFSDNGSSVTTNPSGAYTSGQVATVNGSSTYVPGSGGGGGPIEQQPSPN